MLSETIKCVQGRYDANLGLRRSSAKADTSRKRRVNDLKTYGKKMRTDTQTFTYDR